MDDNKLTKALGVLLLLAIILIVGSSLTSLHPVKSLPPGSTYSCSHWDYVTGFKVDEASDDKITLIAKYMGNIKRLTIYKGHLYDSDDNEVAKIRGNKSKVKLFFNEESYLTEFDGNYNRER